MPTSSHARRWTDAGSRNPRWEDLDASAEQFRERCLLHRLPPNNSGKVDLSYNENPLKGSPAALRVMGKNLAHVHRYPDVGSPLLVAELAERLGVDPKSIAVGSGATNMCVTASWRPLTGRMRRGHVPVIVFSEGSLFAYRNAAKYHHSRVRVVHLRDDLTQDIGAMIQAVDADTRVVFLATPNNPTGLEVPRAEIVRLARALPRAAVLIVDQAYMHFSDHFTDERELLDLAFELGNVLLLRTFSKVYGLAGQRIGYIVGDPGVVRSIRTGAFLADAGGVNGLGAVGAMAALGDDEHVQRSRRFVIEQRTEAMGILRSHGIHCTASQANFVFANVGSRETWIVAELLSAGYVVTAGSDLGIPNWIRFSMAKKEKVMREFTRLLTKLVSA